MIIDHLLQVTSRQAFRAWLLENHTCKTSIWVSVSTQSNPSGLPYLDAVEEAMCFGWIDGIKKRADDKVLAQRFTPRRKKSNWTELNKERARRLIRLGLMTEEGHKTLPDMDSNSFVVDEEILKILIGDETLHQHYLDLPDLYKRIRIDNIQSVKSDRVLYSKRLDKFIEHTKENKLYGQWHDKGRLLED